MPKPTTSWFCDACGCLIEEAGHGVVEWIAPAGSEQGPGHDIRIVHQDGHGRRSGGCRFDHDQGCIGGFSLPEYLGHDGLTRLLEMIEEQDLPTRDLLEIVKRIHVPRYERARRHFKEALAAGVITGDVAFGYWWQDDLRRVLAFAKRRKSG